MQNAALHACGIDMQYARFHIRVNELRSALLLLRKLDFVGINLTVPHKIAAFMQIDEADESATRAGAINIIRVRDEKLIGSTTDGEGFLRAIRLLIDLRDCGSYHYAGGGTGRASLQCALKIVDALFWSIAPEKQRTRRPIAAIFPSSCGSLGAAGGGSIG
jgi:shikimate dehydrogenase